MYEHAPRTVSAVPVTLQAAASAASAALPMAQLPARAVSAAVPRAARHTPWMPRRSQPQRAQLPRVVPVTAPAQQREQQGRTNRLIIEVEKDVAESVSTYSAATEVFPEIWTGCLAFPDVKDGRE
jgi:hypothetical protein